MPHDPPIEFPDEIEDGILIWPSERDFWNDEPLQMKQIEGLKFRLDDLRGDLRARLKSCSIVCHYFAENQRWQFDISFGGIKDATFIHDALDAVETLQMNHERFTSFAQSFGLVGLSPGQEERELGAHVFFP